MEGDRLFHLRKRFFARWHRQFADLFGRKDQNQPCGAGRRGLRRAGQDGDYVYQRGSAALRCAGPSRPAGHEEWGVRAGSGIYGHGRQPQHLRDAPADGRVHRHAQGHGQPKRPLCADRDPRNRPGARDGGAHADRRGAGHHLWPGGVRHYNRHPGYPGRYPHRRGDDLRRHPRRRAVYGKRG